MRVVRTLFWIISVSVLLAGGNGLATHVKGSPAQTWVGDDSPAAHSAQRVVASVENLDGWCSDAARFRKTICTTAGQAGHLLLAGVEGAMRYVVAAPLFSSNTREAGSQTTVQNPVEWGSDLHDHFSRADNEQDELG